MDEGVLAFNKPPGISSAQLIRDVQSHFNPSKHFAQSLDEERRRRGTENSFQRRRRSAAKKPVQVKIGHGGTLDPSATGVLVLGIGSGTKQLHHFLGDCRKSYEAVILFGAATDSYDGVGKIIGRKAWRHVTEEKLREALGQFRGKIMQKPPIFSALRVEGKRLYEYARVGKAVPKEIEERPMQVDNLELVEWMDGGSHGYKIPMEEAGAEVKTVAENLLHLEPENKTSNEQPPDADSSLKDAEDLKRRRDDAEEPTDGLASESKRAKHVDPEVATATRDIQPESDTPNQTPEHRETEEHPKMEEHHETEEHHEKEEHHETKEQPSTSENDGESPPAARIRVTAGSGFYVRSLCHDLGPAVGSLAFMANLVRTRQGIFELGKNVLDYNELDKGEENWSPQVDRLLTDWNNRSGP
ncbi:MAG: hypothetical protein M1831_004379 [Alyxoria varia]|nr:MAG: hypothetical protein M1831_004379 [Alyxoria varia]